MTEITFKYKRLPKQVLFLDSKARFTAYVGGLGSGKTHVGSIQAVEWMLQYPGSIGVITAPTYPMLRDATKVKFMEVLPPELIREEVKGEKKIILINGSEVMFRSLDDPENMRGPNLDWFWIDEAGMCKAMAWKILIGRIRNGRLDRGFLTTTPRGMNWIHTEFVEKVRKDYFLVQSSSKANVFLPDYYVKDLEESYTGSFAQQELEGKFVAFEGLVYNNFNYDVHLIKDEEKPKEFKEFIAGIDWGFTNPMAVAIIGLDADKRAYIIEEFYQRRTDIEQLGEWLKRKKEEYGITTMYADPSEPMHISKLNNMGLNIQRANNRVMPGINYVYSMFSIKKDGKPRIFISSECQNGIKELNSYRYADSQEGKVQKDEPLKVNDHFCDAMRYALYTHLESKGDFALLSGADW